MKIYRIMLPLLIAFSAEAIGQTNQNQNGLLDNINYVLSKKSEERDSCFETKVIGDLDFRAFKKTISICDLEKTKCNSSGIYSEEENGFWGVFLMTPTPKIIAKFSIEKDADKLVTALQDYRTKVCNALIK